MYDLVSIGSLTVDLFFKGESLTADSGRFELAKGGKYFADYFHEGLGGGATNVAIGARRLGLRVALKSTLSDTGFRPLIEEKLQNEHISYLYSHFEKDYHSVSCILLSGKGEKTVINYRTPHRHIFSSEKEKQALVKTNAAYFGNLTDVSLTEKIEAIHLFKKNGVPVILNLGVADCRRTREQLHELLHEVTILIVNSHEFADIVKSPHESLDFRTNLFGRVGLPSLNAVIVTQDKKGSHAYTRDTFYYQSAIAPPKIIDSTGAGDGYTAGFISSYLSYGHIPLAMQKGAEYASYILSKIGAN